MTEEWGPWTEHDGSAPEGLPVGVTFEVQHGGGLFPCRGEVPLNSPCWFWRWKRVRVGWFRKEWRRVCDRPEFAPIIRYRIRRPRGMEILQRLVAQPKEHEPA